MRHGHGEGRQAQRQRHRLERAVGVADIARVVGRQQVGSIVGSLGSGSIARFPGPGTLLPGHVILGEALLSGLGLPVIIAHTPPIDNDAAAKLAKHGTRRDDGNLPRAIRIGQDILRDQIILFNLRRNDLVERPILVEQQVRVPIAQHARTLGSQHEQLVVSQRHAKSPTLVNATTLEISVGVGLFLPGIIEFLWDVLVASFVQLV